MKMLAFFLSYKSAIDMTKQTSTFILWDKTADLEKTSRFTWLVDSSIKVNSKL